MAVDFRFVPLAPDDLSGPAFISQTEEAFNKLGNGIDEASSLASQALNASGSALTTAAEALTTAYNASAEAQAAGDAAAKAGIAAKAAQQEAEVAQGRADEAYDMAADAKSTAGTASGTAQTAQQQADAAYSLAEQSREIASKAQLSADRASDLADLAMGVYVTVEDSVDADEEFIGAGKFLVVNPESLHFPTDVPLYLTVLTDNRHATCTQMVWGASGAEAEPPKHVYYRQARIVEAPDEENGGEGAEENETKNTAEWSAWARLATQADIAEGIASIAPATQNNLGLVQVGEGLNVDSQGVLSAVGGGGEGAVSPAVLYTSDGVFTPAEKGLYEFTLVGRGGNGGMGVDENSWEQPPGSTADEKAGGGGGSGQVVTKTLFVGDDIPSVRIGFPPHYIGHIYIAWEKGGNVDGLNAMNGYSATWNVGGRLHNPGIDGTATVPGIGGEGFAAPESWGVTGTFGAGGNGANVGETVINEGLPAAVLVRRVSAGSPIPDKNSEAACSLSGAWATAEVVVEENIVPVQKASFAAHASGTILTVTNLIVGKPAYVAIENSTVNTAPSITLTAFTGVAYPKNATILLTASMVPIMTFIPNSTIVTFRSNGISINSTTLVVVQ